jgi:hypothetical protein
MYIKIHYKFLYYLLNLQKLFEMRSFMFNAQLITPWYRSTNWLIGLNLNISIDTRECFRLIDYWATLYTVSFKNGQSGSPTVGRNAISREATAKVPANNPVTESSDLVLQERLCT